MSERDYYEFATSDRAPFAPEKPRDLVVSGAAVCTPEERAFLDALKAGGDIGSAQHGANMAWARAHMPELEHLRALAAKRTELWHEWQRGWDELTLPFPESRRGRHWVACVGQIYDYAFNESASLDEKK
jgi:hypothetical protein